jgi:hypothetical protein
MMRTIVLTIWLAAGAAIAGGLGGTAPDLPPFFSADATAYDRQVETGTNVLVLRERLEAATQPAVPPGSALTMVAPTLGPALGSQPPVAVSPVQRARFRMFGPGVPVASSGSILDRPGMTFISPLGE